MSEQKRGGTITVLHPSNTKDFRIKIAIRNNHMVERRQERGLSQPKMAEAIGVPLGVYRDFECLRRKAFNGCTGSIDPHAKAIADFFGVPLYEMFSDAVESVMKDTVEAVMSSGEVASMLESPDPEHLFALQEEAEQATAMLARLVPREQFIVERKNGLNGHKELTYDEIGDLMGVSRERIRQIEQKAYRNLRGFYVKQSSRVEQMAARYQKLD